MVEVAVEGRDVTPIILAGWEAKVVVENTLALFLSRPGKRDLGRFVAGWLCLWGGSSRGSLGGWRDDILIPRNPVIDPWE